MTARQTLKRRIQPYVSEELAQRLEAYTARRNFTESAVIERALREHLDGIGDTALLYQRLDRINRSVQLLNGSVGVLTELLNQFVKAWLRNTPRLPDAEDIPNKLASRERYKNLVRRLNAAVSSGKTFLDELPRDDLDPDIQDDREHTTAALASARGAGAAFAAPQRSGLSP